MLRAVVFDFDGIIVDSEPMHYEAFQDVLKPRGLDFTWEEYCETYIGFDDRDAFQTVHKEHGRDLSDEELAQLIEQKAKRFQHLVHEGQAKPLPGVIELIKSLPGRLPIALCSGALREDIIPILSQLEIAHLFDQIVTAEDTPRSKPASDPYQLTLENLEVEDPARTIAIEDTPAGILSAKGAGMKVLAVTNSYGREFLLEADAITDTLEKIDRSSLENLVL